MRAFFLIMTVKTCPTPLVRSKLLRTCRPVPRTAAGSTFPARTACVQHPAPERQAGWLTFTAPFARPHRGKLRLWAAWCSHSFTLLSLFPQNRDNLEVLTSLHFRKLNNPQLQPPSFKCSFKVLLCHLQQTNHFWIPQQALPPTSVSRLRHSVSCSPSRSENKASTTHSVCASKVAIALCLPVTELAGTAPQPLSFPGELCFQVWLPFCRAAQVLLSGKSMTPGSSLGQHDMPIFASLTVVIQTMGVV